MLLAVLFALALVQDPGGPLLRPGQTVRAQIEDGDPERTTAALEGEYAGPPVLGRSYQIEVEQGGTYRIELRSHFFDAYLVLRDTEGRELADDDNGLIQKHARIVFDLRPGASYRVEACALFGGRGPFELALLPGEPRQLAASERLALEVENAERAVAAIEERDGRSTNLAHAEQKLGRALYYAGRYREALPQAESAVALFEELHGPDHIYVGAALNQLAALRFTLGELEQAKPLYERSLWIAETVNGPEHESVALALGNLAALHDMKGELEEARGLLERALSIEEQTLGEEHVRVAASLNSLGAVVNRLGDLRAAVSLCARSVEIYERLGLSEDPRLAAALHNLGAVLAQVGDVAGARVAYERALAIKREVLGENHPDTIDTLVNLGEALQQEGDYETARRMLERGLAVREEVYGPNHPLVCASLKSLAFLKLCHVDPEEAERLYRRAVACMELSLGPEHYETAAVLDGLAMTLRSQERFGEARELHERSLAIREATLGPDHPRTASGLNNLGFCLIEMEEFAEAARLLERAVAIEERTQSSHGPSLAKALFNLGLAYRGLSRHQESRALLERAFSTFVSLLGPRNPETSITLFHLTTLLLDMGLERVAWQRLRHYGQSFAESSRALLASMSESERHLFMAHVLASVKLELNTAERLGEREAAEQAYESLLAWKGQSGRLLTASRERLTSGASPVARRMLEQLRACQSELSALALEGDVRDRETATERLEVLRIERNRLEVELLRLGGVRDSEANVTLSELRSSLPENTAVVDFFVRGHYRPARTVDGSPVGQGSWSEPRLSAWITRSDREETVHVDYGPAQEVEQALRTFLDELVSGKQVALRGKGVEVAGEREGSSGAQLRRVLWDPLAAHLDGVDTIVVSADKFLGTLPFEALPLEDGSFAIERFAFVYLQDLTSLARGWSEAGALDSALAVGGVDFELGQQVALADASASTGNSGLRSFARAWNPLPATADEARLVTDLHAESFGEQSRRLLLQGAEPTEQRLKRELPRFAVLHLATHGFFQREGLPSLWDRAQLELGSSPMFDLAGRLPGLLSGLVCAGANGPLLPAGTSAAPGTRREDGYLTAEEVGWLDLSGVELVVLSACETGLGRAQSGEGLIGLRRAFRTAGARTVVSSLWSVQDDSTARLMEEFYANLWTRGMGRLEALRAAQLAMLARNREVHGDPRPATWGAFVLSGDFR